MILSAEHERPNRNLARIAEELETDFEALGSTTFKREDLKKVSSLTVFLHPERGARGEIHSRRPLSIKP